MYALGAWFISGICVWIPCIKETRMIMMMIIIIIKIMTIIIIIILSDLNKNVTPAVVLSVTSAHFS